MAYVFPPLKAVAERHADAPDYDGGTVVVALVTKPRGVYVEIPLPLAWWEQQQGTALLSALADVIEHVMESVDASGR